MAIQKILTIPDPLLKKISSPVLAIDEGVRTVAGSLVDTMLANPHCVGIAAPQIAVELRIVVVDASLHHKVLPNNGRMILINPVVIKTSGKQLFREGCLSVPEFTGNVTRAEEITVEYTGLDGNKRELTTRGFESVLLQHEIDHLDGILFLDRVTSLKTDVFRRKQVCK